ncbi:MAG: cytochrome c biogenesis protein CcsA, partial [Bdellovibrionales bacterium]|nr:cytochrome c biogenesis protein CcsA [Bdellovibrionales bacterium]
LARETVLFITGKYHFFFFVSMQVYVGLVLFEQVDRLEIVNIREPDIREQLGFARDRRYVSAKELAATNIQQLAMPLMQKQESGSKNLKPMEKQLLDVFHQMWLVRQVQSADQLFAALQFSDNSVSKQSESPHGGEGNREILSTGTALLKSLAMGADRGSVASQVTSLNNLLRSQPMDSRLQEQLGRVSAEVFYTRVRVFFWTSILLLIMGGMFFWPKFAALLAGKVWWISLFPVLLMTYGLGLRTWITGFSPVTNMYGTMIWVALGIVVFSLVLLKLYKQTAMVGMIWLVAGGVLLMTEGMPLVLSPDLDPIMAVLRSNFWLTTHVLTITISYAAFSIAMIIGNVGLVRNLLFPETQSRWLRSWSHMVYRMVQLGVFLLSVGIILGGVWADYSWGRFWGWDPKETWALIADLGFLLLLHGRFVGWIGPFALLAWSPIAYLLVIMAWYGVNFILATGLHSYGFSSGGAKMVVTYMVSQVTLVGIAVLGSKIRSRSHVESKS